MPSRSCIALLLLLSACATSTPRARAPVARNPRLANLQRAAALPWRDGGQCVVQEASQSWPVLVERCFQALDHERLRFNESTGRCAVASAGAAAMGLGLCILVAPELLVGAVIITGAVLVAVAIKEALEAYELRGLEPEETAPGLETEPALRAPLANRNPKPQPSGQDWLPPIPPELPERARRNDCHPRPVPHLGGDGLHNTCADRVPQNGFPGSDVLVSGKHFDALQLRERVLWEVKTDNFDTYSTFLRRQVIDNQLPELRRERDLARSCGFDFRVGVRSRAHKAALELADDTLEIVLMDWC